MTDDDVAVSIKHPSNTMNRILRNRWFGFMESLSLKDEILSKLLRPCLKKALKGFQVVPLCVSKSFLTVKVRGNDEATIKKRSYF